VHALDPYELVTRMQAGAILTVTPLLVVFVVLQRYFTESIERTGIVE
jgi:multiple sugar transport system permease protein